MKTLLFVVAVALLLTSIGSPIQGQDGGGGESIDITGMLGDRGGGRGGNFNNNAQAAAMPNSKTVFTDIQNALKKGKTPLDKAQEKPLRDLIDLEIVTLSDHVQVIRQTNNNSDQGNFQNNRGGGDFRGGPPGGDFRGGPPGGGEFQGGGFQRGGQQPGNVPAGAAGTPDPNNSATNAFANSLAIQIETITSLKTDEFLETKLATFLSPEQVAVIQKAKADDKTNATCLGGMFDRVSNGLTNNNNNNGGGRGNNNRGGNNFNNIFGNSSKKTNGQPYCMAAEATASDRLEPIRKELTKANLPLAKDKESIAEVFVKSHTKDLEDALRSTLTSQISNRNGSSSINRSTNLQVVLQSGSDAIYKKAGASLNKEQAESLKKWHYEQILGRGGVELLISISAMQDTPLTDDQIARVSAAYPEVRNQLQAAAKAANKTPAVKDLDNSAMTKVVNMLEPAQIASYQAALKYVPVKK